MNSSSGETRRWRIGVDVGGTFTDLLVVDNTTGKLSLYKSRTVPRDPTVGVVNALGIAAAGQGVAARELLGGCELFVHGTTIGTNTLLTGRGSRTALVTTAGFRDFVAVRRGRRRNIWDIRSPFSDLVPRRLRFGVTERVHRDGDLLQALDDAEAEAVVLRALADGVEAFAICFINSYVNPTNELAMAEVVRKVAPQATISVSSDLLPIIGEYERASTAIVDAYIGPSVSSYINRLDQRLRLDGLTVPLLITISNGGVVRAEFCRRKPVLTVLSGPAAGFPAAGHYARQSHLENVVLLDIGGTSADITMLRSGRAEETDSTHIAGQDIAVRCVDVRTIGTGGGSIAQVNSGGLLKVGPDGVGADPGPACYGRGGMSATVTDAQLVLGRLDPSYFLAGSVSVQPALAAQAVDTNVASPLGLTVEAAAYAICRVTTQNLADAIRIAVLERGLDLATYSVVGGGGAAGLMAAEVAVELGITTVIIPKLAAGLCALGMLQADIMHDYVAALVGRWDVDIEEPLRTRAEALRRTAISELVEEGFAKSSVRIETTVDMRYQGQQWHIPVPITVSSLPLDLDSARADFHRLHRAQYGHENRESAVECVQLRVRAVGQVQSIRPASAEVEKAVVPETRAVYVDRDMGFRPIPVFRGGIGQSAVLGPTLVEEPTTTVWVPVGWEISQTTSGDYLLRDCGPTK
jgi:N-methylhydantoinase A